MSDIVSLKERATYQGVTETVIALAQGFGPVIGGLFAEYTTWYVSRTQSLHLLSNSCGDIGDGRSGSTFLWEG